MGDTLHVDVDNLDDLGNDLVDMAGFLDGGMPLGTGDGMSDDVADRVEALVRDALGGARETPLRSTSDQSLARAAPAPAVQDFAENWEGIRAEISSDIRTVGRLLVQSGQSYQDREDEISFEISSATPAAPAVPRDPVLIGGGEGPRTPAAPAIPGDPVLIGGGEGASAPTQPVTQDGPR